MAGTIRIDPDEALLYGILAVLFLIYLRLQTIDDHTRAIRDEVNPPAWLEGLDEDVDGDAEGEE